MNRYQHGVASMLLFGIAVAIGAWAIALASTGIAAAYLLLTGVLFLVVLWGFCTKCPHKGTRCAHVAPGILAAMLPPRREGPYTTPEYAGVAVALLFMILFPQPWLAGHLVLLLLFWGCVLFAVAEIRTSVCRGCANIYCPVQQG
jgi:hypothetical protein